MKDINQGMSMIEIVQAGEDPSLYGSLVANTIFETSDTVNQINDLLTSLSNVDPSDNVQKQIIINQITQLCNNEVTSIGTQIDTDLTAQETLRAASEANDTVRSRLLLDDRSNLVNMVGSDKFKTLVDKLTSVLLSS